MWVRRRPWTGYAAVRFRFRFRAPLGTTSDVGGELGPQCRRPATQRVQLDVLCAPGLELGDVRLTHAEPLGELRLGQAALGAECRELLFDHHLVEVLLHLPLEVGAGGDLRIDPLHEIALSSHHHHLFSAISAFFNRFPRRGAA